jgi:hypothetical protein
VDAFSRRTEKRSEVHTEMFACDSSVLCIDLVGTSENRIRCANDRNLHSPCTKTKNWSSFALIRGVQDSCSFLVFQLVPVKLIASAA